MRDKIEINGIEFTLSEQPNYFLDHYRYGFDLICGNSEINTLHKWLKDEYVFLFKPLNNNNVVICEISTLGHYGDVYVTSVTLVKVTNVN